ncbi:MarR family winged helix-turn-helix transcriptional regulator [Bernardetia sp.]|uniref:MarR family winged helix-turn-helix transcriptional regulator n=1 Tax=Bernardetia sp. TaxID=1937974 RepID=UPI0025C4A1E5|nr:MarR family transcriptional regulator [Bernardetia sp.]
MNNNGTQEQRKEVEKNIEDKIDQSLRKKRRSVDFAIKASWLAIAKMYNMIGAEHGITHSTGFVLLNIDQENGSPATKIAPLMGMEARSLTRILKSMEEEGLIVRQSDTEDRRKVMICLTKEGKLRREAARQSVKTFNKQIFDKLSPEKMEHFFEVIEHINRTAERNLSQKNDFVQNVRQKVEEAQKDNFQK